MITKPNTLFNLPGAETALVHINRLITGRANLNEFHILALPGGFSYGDDVAAGILLANEIKHKLRDLLQNFVDSGKLIIGICNGFQVLVRAGLLPGLNSQIAQEATLAMNTSAKFECRWVHLKTQKSSCAFTHGLKWRLYLPVAHAEGRFTAPSQILDEIESNRQVVFRYVSRFGDIPSYPENPNGSDLHIAGICDPTGRILRDDASPGTFSRTHKPSALDARKSPRERGRTWHFSECRCLCAAKLFVGLRVDKIARPQAIQALRITFHASFPPGL